jgi:uncharacterized phage protein (TIGR01671 family)
MTEFKYRAWDGEKMVCPDYIDRDGIAWWKENSIPICSRTIMQFTGKQDKNEKDIYAGDFLNAPFANGADRKVIKRKIFIALVEWNQDYGWCMHAETDMVYRWFPEWRHCEIIGNKYENPELLPEGKHGN